MYHFFTNPMAYPHLRQYGSDEGELRHISGSPERSYWNKRSPGLPFLINGSGLYEYGALHFSYVLDAYAIEYGALHFSYILGGIVEAVVSESAATVDSVSAAGSLYQSLVGASTGAVASTASVGKLVDTTVTEAGVATSSVALNMTLHALVESTAEAVLYVRVQGEETPVWVVNTGLWAATRFENYPFDSYARIGDRYFAASPDGLFELTGATDAGSPISSSFMLKRDRAQSSQQKRVDRVYVHGTSDKKVEVRVVTPQGDVYAYKSEVDLGDEVTVQRVKLGRGLVAQYWQLEVRNVSGGDLEVDQIEVVSLHTTRKIRRER